MQVERAKKKKKKKKKQLPEYEESERFEKDSAFFPRNKKICMLEDVLLCLKFTLLTHRKERLSGLVHPYKKVIFGDAPCPPMGVLPECSLRFLFKALYDML